MTEVITRRASIATILIIDDEEPVRALLQTTLEAAGHAVVEAPNAIGRSSRSSSMNRLTERENLNKLTLRSRAQLAPKN